MLLNELIEKAFCEGYEYAQKEYARKDYEGLTKRQKEELRQRRRDYAIGLNKVRNDFNNGLEDFAWNEPKSLSNIKSTSEIHGGNIGTKIQTTTNRAGRTGEAFKNAHRKSHLGEMLRQSERAGELMRENVEKEIKPGIAHKEQKRHDWIDNNYENVRGKHEGDFKKLLRDRELGAGHYNYNEINSDLEKRTKKYKEEKQKLKDYANLFDKAEAKERLENIKNIRTKRNKRAALIGAGIAGGAALLGGGIYAYNKHKANKKKKEQEQENED